MLIAISLCVYVMQNTCSTHAMLNACVCVFVWSVFHENTLNNRVRPLRGRPLWGRPCSWVRTDGGNGHSHGNEVTRGEAARGPYETCQIWSWSVNWRWSYVDFLQTAQLAAETLTFDPLTLKLVHGVLVSEGPFLPSLVFVGLFVFPLGGGTGQTDRQKDGQDQHMMGHHSRKDGPITRWCSNKHRVCPVHFYGLWSSYTEDSK